MLKNDFSIRRVNSPCFPLLPERGLHLLVLGHGASHLRLALLVVRMFQSRKGQCRHAGKVVDLHLLVPDRITSQRRAQPHACVKRKQKARVSGAGGVPLPSLRSIWYHYITTILILQYLVLPYILHNHIVIFYYITLLQFAL